MAHCTKWRRNVVSPFNMAHQWFNEQYIRTKSNSELAQFLIAVAKGDDITIPEEKALAIISLLKDRVTFPSDFWRDSQFIMTAPKEFDQEVASKKWNADAANLLTAYAAALDTFDGLFEGDNAKMLLEKTAEAEGIKLGKVMQAVRLAVTGMGAGPDLMQVFAILGPAEVAKRIRFALDNLTVVS